MTSLHAVNQRYRKEKPRTLYERLPLELAENEFYGTISLNLFGRQPSCNGRFMLHSQGALRKHYLECWICYKKLPLLKTGLKRQKASVPT
jgi:hypothetical protein